MILVESILEFVPENLIDLINYILYSSSCNDEFKQDKQGGSNLGQWAWASHFTKSSESIQDDNKWDIATGRLL